MKLTPDSAWQNHFGENIVQPGNQKPRRRHEEHGRLGLGDGTLGLAGAHGGCACYPLLLLGGAARSPTSWLLPGYCQGMGDLLSPLLIVLEDEAPCHMFPHSQPPCPHRPPGPPRSPSTWPHSHGPLRMAPFAWPHSHGPIRMAPFFSWPSKGLRGAGLQE